MTIEMHHGKPDNLLLAYLMDTYEKIKPHTTMILAGALVVMALFYAYRWWDAKNQAEIIETYAEMFDALGAGDTERLEVIGDAFKGLPEGDLALVFAADRHMSAATMELFTNKRNAEIDIESAIESYEMAVESDNENIQRAALLGLARAHEARAATRSSDHRVEESLDTATTTYEALIEEFPDSREAKLAERRRTEIARPSVHDFYKKFASWDQTEVPEDPEMPLQLDLNQLTDGMPFGGSEFPAGMPAIPAQLDFSGNDTPDATDDTPEPVETTDAVETTDPVETTDAAETTDAVEPEATDTPVETTDVDVTEPAVEATEPVDVEATEEIAEAVEAVEPVVLETP